MARKKIQAQEPPIKAAGVFETKKVQIEVAKVYHIATEAEIKKKTKVAKLGRAVLERVPFLKLPSETGAAAEKAYCFRHPDHQLREARVKIIMEANLHSTTLEQDKSYWSEQPQHAFEAALAASGEESGLSNLMDKEQYLHTWDQFCTAKLNLPAPSAVPVKAKVEIAAGDAEGESACRETRLESTEEAAGVMEDDDDENVDEGYMGMQSLSLSGSHQQSTLHQSFFEQVLERDAGQEGCEE